MIKKSFLFALAIILLFPLSLHAENYSVVPAGFQFTRNLGLGNQGQDVENLQCVLEMTQTTGYFGPITKAAVLAFQNAHAAEILTPSGLTTGTGYFGLATRNYMNVQLHNSTSTNPICPTYTATTPDVPQYIPPQTLPTQPTTPTTPPNTVQCPNGYSCVQTPTQNQNQQGLLPTTPSFGQNGGLSGGNVSGNNNTPCGTFANPCAQGQYPPGTVQASPPTQSGSVTTNAPLASGAPANVSQGAGSIVGLPTRGVYNNTMKRNEPYATVVNDSSGSSFVGDVATTFGGPNDHDIDPTTHHDLNLNPLLLYPNCTAHGLDEKSYYMAFRWDYTKPLTTKEKLKSSYARFYNPKTGLYALAVPVDWGPSPDARSNATLDVSQGTLTALGAKNKDKIYFQMVPATAPIKLSCNK